MKIKNRKPELIGKVRTREAPSPTGDPHVGTAMQVMFNWVFAHRYEGQFLVRIEDTDRDRFDPNSEKMLKKAIEWLELLPDEGLGKGGPHAPYKQSKRLKIYHQYAQQLIDKGYAYYCFCSKQRLDDMRKKQQKEKKPPKYDRHCLNLSEHEIQEKIKQGIKPVVRMKIPQDRTIVVNDMLRGKIEFDSNIIDDQVILKSDGFPTYHLAVVVDDHLMRITHMKRGEEWLPSAPKHVLLYEFFGWSPPKMIHTPTLRNPDRSKLSKRKGNTSLWWYRSRGFLREALLNFLALLVWKPKDQREIFSLQDMIATFEWKQMNVTGPIFDIKKLKWINGHYIRDLSLDKLQTRIHKWASWVKTTNFDQKENAIKILNLEKEFPQLYKNAIKLAQERMRAFAELYDLIEFYFIDKLDYDLEDLLQGHKKAETQVLLQTLYDNLNKLTKWESDNWENTIRSTADELDFKHKDAFMSLRSAVTARKFTPPLFNVMITLGRDVSLSRIKQAIKFIS